MYSDEPSFKQTEECNQRWRMTLRTSKIECDSSYLWYLGVTDNPTYPEWLSLCDMYNGYVYSLQLVQLWAVVQRGPNPSRTCPRQYELARAERDACPADAPDTLSKSRFSRRFSWPFQQRRSPSTFVVPLLLGSYTLGSPKLQNLANRLCAVTIVLDTAVTLSESLRIRGGVVLKQFRRHGTVSSNRIFAMIQS